MDTLYCATCGQQLSERHIKKSRKQGRIPKYCSVTCWGKRKREYNYDHTFMNDDTELAAYFMGWWTADGYIDKEGGLGISSKDRQLIYAFAEQINYKNIISESLREGRLYPEYNLHIAGDASKRIQEMGYARGAKGGKEFLPDRFNQGDLFFHFLRGFIDGDGTIKLFSNNSLSVSMVNMSCELLFSIWEYLYFNKFIRGGCLSETRPNFYRLGFGHYDSVQIGNLIYKNANIKLDRKYHNYLAGRDFVQGCVPQANSDCNVLECGEPAMCLGLCRRHYDTFYRKAHPEQSKAYGEKWRKAHLDKVNNSRRRRYSANPEQHRQYVRNYRKNNPDKIREYKRKYREEHKEEINTQKRAYRQSHLEKIRMQERAARQRSMERCRLQK